MATQPISDRFVPVEEYLSTSYQPDCEYEEGVVVKRNLGEIEHAFVQTLLAALFTNQMEAWGVYGLTEQRVQLSPHRYVVPDVCVVPVSAPWQNILTRPPLIAIEVLSPEDTRRSAEKKAAEYLGFGVEHVWVIDPYARVAYRASTNGLELQASGELAVPGTPITVRLSELFEKLDRVLERSGEK
jgi:Uma2 family endonuclease